MRITMNSEKYKYLLNDLIAYNEFSIEHGDALVTLRMVKDVNILKKINVALREIESLMIGRHYQAAIDKNEELFGQASIEFFTPLRETLKYWVSHQDEKYVPTERLKNLTLNNDHVEGATVSVIKALITEYKETQQNNSDLTLQKLELISNKINDKPEFDMESIKNLFKSNVELYTDIIDKINKLSNIPDLAQEAVGKRLVDHKTLVSAALSNISTQVEANQRKMLTDLISVEVKVIANEVNRFITNYNVLLDKVDKKTTVFSNNMTALCEETINAKEEKTFFDLKAISRTLIKISLISTLITAPILGFTTGYITSKMNKITFFNALNDIVNNKKNK